MPAVSAQFKTKPFQILARAASGSTAANVAKLTVASVDLHRWASQVCTAPSEFVLQTVVQIPGFKASPIPYLLLGSTAKCEAHRLLAARDHHEVLDVDVMESKMFAIILAHVTGRRLAFVGEGNHVIAVYLHRASPGENVPWNAVVCDPNFSDSQELSEEDRLLLYQAGAYALNHVAWPPTKPSVQNIKLHRCVNVNRCVRSVNGGICFTALCATLVATEIQCLRTGVKASDGTALMNMLLEASVQIVPDAEWLVAMTHLGISASHISKVLKGVGRWKRVHSYLKEQLERTRS